MTIDAGHAGLGVARAMPRSGLGVVLVALDTLIRARFLAEDAVWVVTGRACEVVGAANLVGLSRFQHVANFRGLFGSTLVVPMAIVAYLPSGTPSVA